MSDGGNGNGNGSGYTNGNGQRWAIVNNVMNGLVSILLVIGWYLYTQQQETIEKMADKIEQQRVEVASLGADFRSRLRYLERAVTRQITK